MINMEIYEKQFELKIIEEQTQSCDTIKSAKDPSHDLLHIKRVLHTAKQIGLIENANFEILIPAVWLHDFYQVPKNSENRKKASWFCAEKAIDYLKSINYPAIFFDEIFHAIHAHSFSANIETKTIEAKVLQDADRIDALGAIGIARCFATGGIIGSDFYSLNDPFAQTRELNDNKFSIDHFYKKLFTLPDTMKTHAGKVEANKRVIFMNQFLEQLRGEIYE